MMKLIMRHLKRKHDALYVQLVWMEPFGNSTWCVWITPVNGNDYGIGRSSSKWLAFYEALKTPVRKS